MMADSPSLWNRSSAPGWTAEERDILRRSVMKFGIGRWREIVDCNCLPGKTPSQLNLQVQRLMGQQSLRDFMGLHVDPKQVFEDNALKEGFRKNGCLINTGNNPRPEERAANIEANRKRYGLTKETVASIELPSFPAVERKPTDKPTDRPRPEHKDKKDQKKKTKGRAAAAAAPSATRLRPESAHVDAAVAKLNRLEGLVVYMEQRLNDLREKENAEPSGATSDPNDSPTSDMAPPKPKPKPKFERRQSAGRRRKATYADDYWDDDFVDFQLPPGYSIEDFDGFVEQPAARPTPSSASGGGSGSKRRRRQQAASDDDDDVSFETSEDDNWDGDEDSKKSKSKSKGKSRSKSGFF